MKIGLIDVDGKKFPNLALMKVAAFHKKAGDSVEWINYFESYDIVYKSKIFTFSPDQQTWIQSERIITGGTGYDIHSKLPPEIDEIRVLDYSIYPNHPFSLQYFSRGCIRKCPFCVVREKEGYIAPSIPYDLNPAGKWIEVLDNNFFANPEWREAIKYLINAGQPVNLHGVDVRIMDEEQAYNLNRLKLSGRIHIAWDNPKDKILPHIENMLRFINSHKIVCYVLIGYNSTIHEDYERVKQLKKLKITPFVMPYRDYTNTRTPTQYEKDFATWVNGHVAFNSCDFKEFQPRKGFKCSEYFKCDEAG